MFTFTKGVARVITDQKDENDRQCPSQHHQLALIECAYIWCFISYYIATVPLFQNMLVFSRIAMCIVIHQKGINGSDTKYKK